MSLRSPQGEEGFPGNLDTIVTYRLLTANLLPTGIFARVRDAPMDFYTANFLEGIAMGPNGRASHVLRWLAF